MRNGNCLFLSCDFIEMKCLVVLSREAAISTNVGKLLERRGKEFLGLRYKDPISNFSDLQEFSVANPEVR